MRLGEAATYTGLDGEYDGEAPAGEAYGDKGAPGEPGDPG